MTKQALRPDYFISKLPSFQNDVEADKKGATEEEKQLYALAQTKGWKVLSEYFENILDELDNLNAVAIEQGASFDVIGQNTVIVNMAKGIIKKMLNKVNDAIDACQNEK